MAQITTSSIRTIVRGIIKDLLKDDGRDVFEYDNDSSFKLSSSRVSASTITVYVNGTDITDSNWSYNSGTNKVTISSSLTSGDNVLIVYSYYESYSDSEINSYIKSSLVYFTKHRYKKHFYMNDSDEVVTLNGANPDNAEGNIIALVTAVNIDPNNINVRTRDYSISSEENKSKSEQIQEIINGFTRGYIVVDFMENKS